MEGSRRRRVVLCVLAVACGLWLGTGTAAARDRVVVGDLYAEPDVRDEAGAVTLLVRSMLASSKRAVVPWGELDNALTRLAGSERRAGLVIAPQFARQVAQDLGASHVIGGEVQRAGIGLAASIRVFDDSGRSLGIYRFVAGHGDVTGLARQIAVAVGSRVGTKPRKHPAASVGQLRPFARAAAALLRADMAMAGAALAGADPVAAGRVPAARQLARPVWTSGAVPFERRVGAALAGVEPSAAMELADASLAKRGKDAVALAARSRAHLAALDLAGADAALAAVPRKHQRLPEVLLARAELAHRRGTGAARDAALKPLLGGAPHVPALPFAATIPPGVMSDVLEQAALESAAWARGPHPRLSSALALRAARGDVDVERALGLVFVVELDDSELRALEPVVEQAVGAGWPVGHRLATELAMRRGAIDAAIASARLLLEHRPGDHLGHTYLGRLLTEKRDFDGAVTAFGVAARDGDSNAVREHARSLARAGNASEARARWRALADDDTSAELLRVRAARLIEDGDTRAAEVALQRAVALNPHDGASQRTLADVYERAGKLANAAEARKRAEAIERDRRAAAPSATDQVDLSGAQGDEPGARRAAVSRDDAAAQAQVARLSDELPSLLDVFPALAERRLRRVVLVALEGSHEPFWSPQQVVPERLRDALERALSEAPYDMTVHVSSVSPQAEPLRASVLRELAADDGADSVLLYRVRADGSKAAVELTLYLVDADSAFNADDVLPGRTTGMVVWNATFLVVAGALLAAALAWLAWTVVRGRGSIVVRLKLDPGTDRDAFSLKVSRAGSNPGVSEPVRFAEEALRAGHKQARLSASVVGPVTEFSGVPTGGWHVHLYGTYQKGGELRVLARDLSDRAKVRRNQTAYVDFDLVPAYTEYVLHVFDGQLAVAGGQAWVEGRDPERVTTDADGQAVVKVPPGSHMIRIVAGDLAMSRRVTVADTKVHNVHINLERERRMADISGGISLEAGAEQGPASVPTASMVAFTDSVGRPLASSAPQGGPATMAAAPAAAPAVPASDTATGLSRYQVLMELGRGAMGVVYKARDAHLERDVALKIMTEEMRQHPGALELFLREAKALAQLHHANVVTVFDQGQDRGRAFMVMEFVDGRTLESLLETESTLPLTRALDVCDQLCRGLAYAHGRKVIHRDIKPANIFISDDQIVKLGDFGLARVVNEIKIQRTEIRGTPLYMAPEQIRGTDIDFRADLYAVGCTMFELVTGRPPFVEGEILYHHMHTAPPHPTQFQLNLPPELDGLIMRCIEKSPSARPNSADAIRTALRPLIHRYS